jgi:heptosyltransferase I
VVASSSNQPQKILVLRLGSMGDIIHSMPAVSSLRASFPDALLGWAVEERWAALLSSAAARTGPRGPEKPLVDILHIVNTRAWRTAPFSDETWREIKQTISGLRAVGYDVSIDIQGAIKSAVLGRFARPRRRFGFAQPWESAATMFYTHQVQATGIHIADRNRSLAAAAGADAEPENATPIPIDAVAEVWADAELKTRDIREFAIINPGSGWGSKCWPAKRFGELARRLSSNGITALVNFGSGEEELVTDVEDASGGAAKRIACTVAELIALTRRAALFVGGDTGPLHLAVALNTPSVALFGPTDPARNGPYGGRAIVVRSPQSVTTYKRSAQFEEGLSSIRVDAVIGAASQLLGRPLA